MMVRVGALVDRLMAKDVRVHIPWQDRDYYIYVGLRMLILRKIVAEGPDGQLIMNENDRPIVAYYANAIRHLL